MLHRNSRMLKLLSNDAEGMCFFSSGPDAEFAVRSLWRNGRARWTSNPEVPGSSPGRDGLQDRCLNFSLISERGVLIASI